jgi:DMSO/TMAO reductase YedYZ molybdopterin-dependent catalytic subunit
MGSMAARAAILAGLAAGLAMVLVQFIVRIGLGVSPPPEAVPDRFAPLLGISLFFSLLDLFRGYSALKQFGVGSILLGELAVAVAIAVAYRRVARGRLIFLVGAALVAWLVSLLVLWPVLPANYRGAPVSVAPLISALGLLAGFVTFGVVLHLLMQRAHAGTRRSLVFGGLAAAATLVVGRQLFELATFAYDGHENRGDLEPITPTDRFYSVTKNVVDPTVDDAWWRLSIGGLVERPTTYSLADLRGLGRAEQETTLMCISNYLGGALISNARWAGVSLKTVLDAARIRPGAVELLLRGADGYTDSVPLAKALDGTCFVAYEMNGQALPSMHGGPVRLLIPGLFGEKSVKWVTGIEVVDHDARGFYEQQGWGPNFVIPTRSQFTADMAVGRVGESLTVNGWAFGGDRGIAAVELSDDDGASWRTARIAYPGTAITWSLWSFDWRSSSAGDRRLIVRATDGLGQAQPVEYRDTAPQGATGLHSIVVHIQA